MVVIASALLGAGASWALTSSTEDVRCLMKGIDKGEALIDGLKQFMK